MFSALARKIFGSVNDRVIGSLSKTVEQINALEAGIQPLTDSQLKAKTEEFKSRLEKGETLDDILPEAFAVTREAAKRVLNMRHFDVQLMGGIILHRGMITEMKTGEGKTLVATLPVYLNALTGKGAHVVTVNDYLAQRDAAWMGKIYEFLGLTVGNIVHGLDDEQRRVAYAADVTYGTNNEFGFDYLRDNMKFNKNDMVQRPFNFSIVDEVDSILIDEARTPLIISGAAEDSSELYYQVNALIQQLEKGDFEIDEKARSVTLNEEGTNKIEELLKKSGLLNEDAGMYDVESISLVHHVNQALKAYTLFAREKDYIVKDNQVIIIDEFTGRMMEGRRYSEGLHQAIEAKENVPVQNENQTLASVTFQNYFRLYPKLAGMTGTAMTEATEFQDIYGLEVVEMPPNLNIIRDDKDDEIYRTAQEKYDAIIAEIEACHKRGQPILVGTVTIEKSEFISKLLKKKKIPHNVLNAKHHEKEAHIIAQAGRLKAVTIATNMAGRGTDIMLGGNPEMLLEDAIATEKNSSDEKKLRKKIEDQVAQEKEQVLAAGGLYVLGTERHESRRIDNQLRGRSGRQGDPGVSKFFLSLEDDLLRIFGSERIGNMLKKLGLPEGEAVTHPWINRALEKAQHKVEQHHYEVRKNILKFDDVMNDQRKVIYAQRIDLMERDDVSDTIEDMRKDVVETLVANHIPQKSYAEQWDMDGLEKEIYRIFGMHLPVKHWAEEEGIAEEEITQRLDKEVDDLFAGKVAQYGAEPVRYVEKRILLLTLDQLWKDHLLQLDHLRQGIGLRSYGQKDPLNEYKREAFMLFEEMLDELSVMVSSRVARMEISEAPSEEIRAPQARMQESRVDPAFANQRGPIEENGTPIKARVSAEERDAADPSTWGRVGRNELCPCGSGKKYKQCHGAI